MKSNIYNKRQPSYAVWNDFNQRHYGALSVPPRIRRAKLLLRAVRDTLYFHREGGLALANPDVKWLIRHGYLQIVRSAYGSGWVHDGLGDYDLRVTKGRITESGWDALWNERF